jgi:hypothetical protein
MDLVVASELHGAQGKLQAAENLLHTQTLPKLLTHMHRASGAGGFHADPIGVNGDQFLVTIGRRPRRGARACSPLTNTLDKVLHFGVGRIQQALLTHQAVFHAMCQLQPLLGRARAEIAQRTDDLLPWAFGGMDRLDQQVVGVGLVLIAAGVFSEEHSHYI